MRDRRQSIRTIVAMCVRGQIFDDAQPRREQLRPRFMHGCFTSKRARGNDNVTMCCPAAIKGRASKINLGPFGSGLRLRIDTWIEKH
jgi:hypothetical protein